MTRTEAPTQPALFDAGTEIELEPGARLLRGFARGEAAALLAAIDALVQHAPLRQMDTPGGRMSVAMTNCGDAGWVSTRSGYRYDAVDPLTRRPWPHMPAAFAALAARAARAAGFDGFAPNACIVNRYAPGARLSLHQDRDEIDLDAPIVSVSLGVPATFLWGGATRAVRPTRVPLEHGDVVVWGGPARLHFHGVDTLRSAQHALTGDARFNLTLRRTRWPR